MTVLKEYVLFNLEITCEERDVFRRSVP
jgi:hypothetical protein